MGNTAFFSFKVFFATLRVFDLLALIQLNHILTFCCRITSEYNIIPFFSSCTSIILMPLAGALKCISDIGVQEQKMVLCYIQRLCDNKESSYDLVVLMLMYQKRGGSQIYTVNLHNL